MTIFPPRRVAIIVPVYNEQKLFPLFYEAVVSHVHVPWRLLIIYDTSTDETLPVARPVAERDPRVQLVENPAGGVANAIKVGFRAADAEAVFITAIDLPEDLLLVDQMTDLLYQNHHAIVAPSRYMRGGSRAAGALLPRTLSRFASLSLHFFAGVPIHDATNGSKMYAKKFLDTVTIESESGWSIALELTVKATAASYTMAELPTTHAKRKAGASKFRLAKWLPGYLHWYFFALRARWLGHASVDAGR